MSSLASAVQPLPVEPVQAQPELRRSARAAATAAAASLAADASASAWARAAIGGGGRGASKSKSTGPSAAPRARSGRVTARTPKNSTRTRSAHSTRYHDPDESDSASESGSNDPPSAGTSSSASSHRAGARHPPAEPSVNDADVVEDDAFALALKFASRSLAPPERPRLPSPTLSMPSPAPREREEWDEEAYGADESFLFPEGDGEGDVAGVEVRGRTLWMKHVETRMRVGGEGKRWTVEGYAGLEAAVSDMTLYEVETSIAFDVEFEVMHGSGFRYAIDIVFENLESYPSSSDIIISATSPATGAPPNRAHLRAFERFLKTYGLSVKAVIERLVCALQGHDDAGGGEAPVVAEGPEAGPVAGAGAGPAGAVSVPEVQGAGLQGCRGR